MVVFDCFRDVRRRSPGTRDPVSATLNVSRLTRVSAFDGVFLPPLRAAGYRTAGTAAAHPETAPPAEPEPGERAGDDRTAETGAPAARTVPRSARIAAEPGTVRRPAVADTEQRGEEPRGRSGRGRADERQRRADDVDGQPDDGAVGVRKAGDDADERRRSSRQGQRGIAGELDVAALRLATVRLKYAFFLSCVRRSVTWRWRPSARASSRRPTRR